MDKIAKRGTYTYRIKVGILLNKIIKFIDGLWEEIPAKIIIQ